MVTIAPEAARLRRVFELELEQGGANRLVVGGLDRMLIQLLEDGGVPIGSAFRAQVSELPVGGYRALETGARKAWLQATLAALDADHRGPLAVRQAPAARAESAPAAPRNPGARPLKRRPAPVPAEPASPKAATGSPGPLALDMPVSRLPGVGKAGAARFEKLGVVTAGDAVTFFPRRYNDFTDLRTISELTATKEPQTVVATVFSVREMRYGRRVKGAEALLQDRTGTLRATWFNMPYIARQLHEGEQVVASGRVRAFRGRLQLENPEIEPFDADLAAGRMVPVYPATQGLSQRTLRHAIGAAVAGLAERLPDPVPAAVRARERLTPMAGAIRTMHNPGSAVEAEEARQRLALGEFLAIQCAVLQRRAEWQLGAHAPSLTLGEADASFRASLPFALTPAQEQTLAEVQQDIRGPLPMLRLLQGDVGSGKTVVAFAAMLAAVRSGYQAAIMAPTEILAEQHYRSFARMLGGEELSPLDGMFAPAWLGRPLRMVLVTGSLTANQKGQVRSDAANGGADVLIGTHALLEDDVILPRLALAVVDEQHRFGVSQRAKLRKKGLNPHLLVMTATPIPRTLALTVYGDIEVSTIDELPPGRKPVRTAWVQPHERDEAYAVIRERLDAGEQAYVICPLVEESEALDVRSAEEEFERLRAGPLSRYRLELLHGRMPGRQKDDIMSRFARGEIDVLVSTSVIEVGIDVANATVIVIEGAERFGLSQLHQFRGRVGRSAKQSYCMLFSSAEDPGPDARERLEAMVDTNDGFRLAEVDLAMRGEGEAWGTLQSGANTMLRVARLSDRELLMRARALANEILAGDPDLQRAEHRALAAAVKPFLTRATEAN